MAIDLGCAARTRTCAGDRDLYQLQLQCIRAREQLRMRMRKTHVRMRMCKNTWWQGVCGSKHTWGNPARVLSSTMIVIEKYCQVP